MSCLQNDTKDNLLFHVWKLRIAFLQMFFHYQDIKCILRASLAEIPTTTDKTFLACRLWQMQAYYRLFSGLTLLNEERYTRSYICESLSHRHSFYFQWTDDNFCKLLLCFVTVGIAIGLPSEMRALPSCTASVCVVRFAHVISPLLSGKFQLNNNPFRSLGDYMELF
jgi:hypothetical protein